MIAYPAKFTQEGKAITVTFPDIAEAITCGYSEAEALDYAADALETALSEYINRRREIPIPSKPRVRNMRLIVLPALAEAKIGLYRAMRQAGVRKAELARRLRWRKSQVDRLLNLRHASRLGQIEIALNCLHKRLTVRIDDAA